MYDVIIVGAGASGLMLAASLKMEDKNIKILILEKNDKLGKKLSITGNGKCNLGNLDISLGKYHSRSNLDKFKKYLNNDLYIDYLKKIGILVREDNGLLYPYSNQAISVCKSFERYLNKYDVDIKYDYEVIKLEKKDDIFVVNNNIKSKKVVISTGGLSYPKTGSTGIGYNLLKQMGHFVTKLYPSLIGLKTNNRYIKDISGVRFDSVVSLIVDDKKINKENGQVQFGNDYLSGICIFNLSYNVKKYIEEKKHVEISINLVPDYNLEELKQYIYSFLEYKIEDALSCVINNKLANYICKSLNVLGLRVKKISNELFNEIIFNLQNMKFNIIDTKDISEAQVTSGGAILDEFSDGLESKLVKGLYATGEVLDIDGFCGGYNLAWAFISSIIVSKSIME